MNDPHHRTQVRAYYLWLSGWPGTDEDRWLLAKAQQEAEDREFQDAMLRSFVGHMPEPGDAAAMARVFTPPGSSLGRSKDLLKAWDAEDKERARKDARNARDKARRLARKAASAS